MTRPSRRGPHRGGRENLAPAALLVTAALLGGCGGAAAPRPVAMVAGSAISAAQLAHWSAIKRAEGNVSNLSGANWQQQALRFLITTKWLEGEAQAHKVYASSAEVKPIYRRLLAAPNGPALAASLRARQMNESDELLVLRVSMLSQRLQEELAGSPAWRTTQAREAYLAAFRRRWRLRTRCAARYVIAECGNGPALQGTPPAAR